MKLQDSYKELEELKDRLENKESTWKDNLTDAQKDSEKTKSQVCTVCLFTLTFAHWPHRFMPHI